MAVQDSVVPADGKLLPGDRVLAIDGEEMVAVRSEDSDEEFIRYLKTFEDPGAFIDFHSGPSLELRPRELDGEVRWVLIEGAEERPLLPYRFAGWLSFLQRAPYAGFVNPAPQRERGLTPPIARVTLFPPDEAPIELTLGREVEGEVFLQNRTSGMLLLLPQGWPELIVPSKAALTAADGPNPWERWLR